MVNRIRNLIKIGLTMLQIGKRNLNLNKQAIKVAKEIRRMDSKTAKWIASDALRELMSRAIQERVQGE